METQNKKLEPIEIESYEPEIPIKKEDREIINEPPLEHFSFQDDKSGLKFDIHSFKYNALDLANLVSQFLKFYRDFNSNKKENGKPLGIG